MGKLDGPAWIEGLAMYRISHTNDFYPGLLNPDFLFNRVLPSKLITWSSLFIELTCFITIWIPLLRIPTLVVVFAFHVGIDLAMNMHCFEWLTLVGWSSFLAQRDSSQKKAGLLRKSLSNLFIVGVLTLFSIDSFPMRYMYRLTPRKPTNYLTTKLRGMLWNLNNYQNMAYDRIFPLLAATGIEQGTWDMYSGYPDDSNSRLEAVVRFRNGTNETWTSPDWLNMTWLERKRYARVMDYYECIEDKMSESAWKALCIYLARQFGDDVQSVDLGKYTESSVYPLPNEYKHGWFEVSRQFPMKQSRRRHLWFIADDDLNSTESGMLGNQTWTLPTFSIFMRTILHFLS